MSEIDKQKRMTNILLAGNLATNYKSAKMLQEMKNIQSQQLEGDKQRNFELQKQSRMQEEQLREQRRKIRLEEEKQEKKEQEIKLNKMKREVFFDLSEELDEVKKNKKTKLENYFILASMQTNLQKYNISSSMTDDFQEKKVIKDFITNLNDYSNVTWSSFSDNEYKDYEIILDILEVNEEEKINIIKNSGDYKDYIKLEKEINSINECNKLHLLIKDYKKYISSLK